MSVYTVTELVDQLTRHYEADELLAVTWWAKDDMEQYIIDEDIEGYTAEELWQEVVGDVDSAIDDAIPQVNDRIVDIIAELKNPQED